MKRLAFIALLLISTLATAQNNFKWISQQTYVATGTNTYTVTIPGYTANTIGSEVKVLFTNGNTGASTLQIGSLAAVTLRKNGSSPLSSGDLLPGATYRLTFDGTFFQVLGLSGGGGGSVAWGDVTGKPNLITLPSAPTATENRKSVRWNNATSTWNYFSIDNYLWPGDSTNISMKFGQDWGESFGLKVWKDDVSYGSNFSVGYDFIEFYHQSSPADPSGSSTNGFSGGPFGMSLYSTDFNNFGSTFSVYDSIKLTSFDFVGIYKQTDEDPFGTPKQLIAGFGKDGFGNREITFPSLSAAATETWAITVNDQGILSSQAITSGATNLAFTPSSTNGIVTSDTGTDATIPLGNGTNSGLSLNDYTTAEKSKLAGIATGANNYVHPNHTGDVTSVSDGATTISNDAVTNAKAANMAVNTIKGRITAGTGDPEDLTAAQVRTITETETTTQLNTRDTNNRNRTNHTGTQPASTISDFNAESRAQTEAALIAGTNITITPAGSGATRTLTIAATGGGGGITNGAANNELMKSDGTNAIPSGLSSPSAGDINLGLAATTGTVRQITATGSEANIDVQLYSKGTGSVRTTKHEILQVNAGTNDLVEIRTVNRQSSGTVAAGFGVIDAIRLENASNTVGSAVEWRYAYVNPANGAEVSSATLVTKNSGSDFIPFQAEGNKIGFFAATPVVKQSAPTTAQEIADVLTAYGLIPASTISGGGGSGLTYAQVKALKFK